MIKWLRGLVHGPSIYSDETETDPSDEALLIRIEASTIWSDVSLVDDLDEVEQDLQALLGDECEVDGHDIGAREATIYVYGPSADAMFSAIREYLAMNPLTTTASVTLRFGPLGSEQTVRGLR